LEVQSQDWKKTETRLDQTALGPQILRTGKDRNRGPVLGLSGFLKFRDRGKTGLTGLNQSLPPQTKVSISTHCQLIITLCRYYNTDSRSSKIVSLVGIAGFDHHCRMWSLFDDHRSPTISSCLSPRRMPLRSGVAATSTARMDPASPLIEGCGLSTNG